MQCSGSTRRHPIGCYGWSMISSLSWRQQPQTSGPVYVATHSSTFPVYQDQRPCQTHLTWQMGWVAVTGGVTDSAAMERASLQYRTRTKGKRPVDSESSRRTASIGPAAKKPKKEGTCQFLNNATGGNPYEKVCIFTHCCTNYGALDDHGWLRCPLPARPPRDARIVWQCAGKDSLMHV